MKSKRASISTNSTTLTIHLNSLFVLFFKLRNFAHQFEDSLNPRAELMYFFFASTIQQTYKYFTYSKVLNDIQFISKICCLINCAIY